MRFFPKVRGEFPYNNNKKRKIVSPFLPQRRTNGRCSVIAEESNGLTNNLKNGKTKKKNIY
jgi:hypothetical protein